MTHQLDEGRVLLASHDLFVDRPGPLGRQYLAAKLLLAHEQREVREHRLRRYRIQVVAFHQRTRAIAKLLVHLEMGDAAIPIDGDGHVTMQPLHGGVGQPAVRVGLDPPLGASRRRGGQQKRCGEGVGPRALDTPKSHGQSSPVLAGSWVPRLSNPVDAQGRVGCTGGRGPAPGGAGRPAALGPAFGDLRTVQRDALRDRPQRVKLEGPS